MRPFQPQGQRLPISNLDRARFFIGRVTQAMNEDSQVMLTNTMFLRTSYRLLVLLFVVAVMCCCRQPERLFMDPEFALTLPKRLLAPADADVLFETQ